MLGCEVFWNKAFDKFVLVVDNELRTFLSNFPKRKDTKKTIARTKEGKSRRSNQRNRKLQEELKKDLEAQKKGMVYGTVIGVKEVQREAKYLALAQCRDPKSTPKTMLRCKYWHHDYCQVCGHSLAMSSECFMNRQRKRRKKLRL